MTLFSNDLYIKISDLAAKVKKNLRKQGIIIPVDHKDGSIQIGAYYIVKNSIGLYSIKDLNHEIVVDHINLPQTAALIANDLALGGFLNQDLLKTDRNYGYALFEEKLYKKALERSLKLDYDRYELLETKFLVSSSKKESSRNSIHRRFEKLRKLA